MKPRGFYREQPVAQEGSCVGLVLDTDLKILGFTKAIFGSWERAPWDGAGPLKKRTLGYIGLGMGGHWGFLKWKKWIIGCSKYWQEHFLIFYILMFKHRHAWSFICLRFHTQKSSTCFIDIGCIIQQELIEIITQKSGFLLLVGLHDFTSSSGVRVLFVVVVWTQLNSMLSKQNLLQIGMKIHNIWTIKQVHVYCNNLISRYWRHVTLHFFVEPPWEEWCPLLWLSCTLEI